MKSLLLLALSGVLFSPITAKAASYKLLVKVNQNGKISTSVLTMASEKACKEGKKKVLQNSEWKGNRKTDFGVAAICIKSE
tara:strand:- start:248 stop:490 length:243 start_codon:yes stop_codon:yes gene_type:complete